MERPFPCELLLILFLFFIKIALCSDENINKKLFDLSAIDIRGKTVKFKKYEGQVLLIVNVATYCGFTSSNYPDLVKMQEVLGSDDHFTILAFPCNQFGEQEPDTNKEIEEFAFQIYKVNFPMFSKIEVRGIGAHPVYQYLKDKTLTEPDWNFWKYLVDHKGRVINHWEPEVPMDEIFPAVEEAILDAKKEDKKRAKKEL